MARAPLGYKAPLPGSLYAILTLFIILPPIHICLNWGVHTGNLSWNTTDENLRVLRLWPSSRCSIVMRDRDTGRSRGFGFVTYSSGEEANAAVGGPRWPSNQGQPCQPSWNLKTASTSTPLSPLVRISMAHLLVIIQLYMKSLLTRYLVLL
ncbi:RNA recognition motif domain-containing protein [Rhizoctonia solani AG-1 IA]|uniref:RNA recognition motif domain-containing protein n=1 Tax=Thanatephorus cucumeris (strain AG1-IA) TaxID=983506 RepID=L8WJ19_THACA|nr:RNA recognition motif domain-containing protein [Rhizoctonia solani AG-1 IA]